MSWEAVDPVSVKMRAGDYVAEAFGKFVEPGDLDFYEVEESLKYAVAFHETSALVEASCEFLGSLAEFIL